MFVIQADKSRLTIIESEMLVSNAIGVYQIRFSFSDDWNEFAKIAVFYNDFDEDPRSYSVLIDSSGMAYIPHEVLKDVGGRVHVGVCGESTSQQHLPTVIVSLGQVVESICGESIESKDPTPSIYQQILSELASIRRDIDSGALRGPMGPRGLKGEQGLKGEKGDPGDLAFSVDPETLIMSKDRVLSVRPDIIVRGASKDDYDQMTEEDKKGLVIVAEEDEEMSPQYVE